MCFLPGRTRGVAATGTDQQGEYAANAYDVDGRVGIDWGVYGAPETFIIDRQGIIRHKHVGPLTVEILNEQILPLIDELQSST